MCLYGEVATETFTYSGNIKLICSDNIEYENSLNLDGCRETTIQTDFCCKLNIGNFATYDNENWRLFFLKMYVAFAKYLLFRLPIRA